MQSYVLDPKERDMIGSIFVYRDGSHLENGLYPKMCLHLSGLEHENLFFFFSFRNNR